MYFYEFTDRNLDPQSLLRHLLLLLKMRAHVCVFVCVCVCVCGQIISCGQKQIFGWECYKRKIVKLQITNFKLGALMNLIRYAA